ncbi:MAG: NAD(P)/FAD-dependent oxidoreductase [Clostridiaceae bacterium]|nr:NAD(P)/FAD-dependent oxidoreductase [Clostridiaceae bacterium]
MYDVAVIGAGIIGCSISRVLSRYEINVVLIEKGADVADCTTKANSAIIHAGYDAKPGTLKAKFNALGNLMFEKLCQELDVTFKKTGSLVLAFNEEDMETINKLFVQGIINGIDGMEILDREKVLDMEPRVNKEVIGGLYAATCGVVGPWELAIAQAENAAENGVEILLNSEVKDIKKQETMYSIFTSDRTIDARYIINCAGLYADRISNMVATESFRILPRRGEYNIFDKSVGDIVNTVIFPCPSKLGKGILVSPTVHGNLLIGPNACDIYDKEAFETTSEGLEFIKEGAERSVPDLPYNAIITSFSGLRARCERDDFIIEEALDSKGFINVAGIESPGLTSSPAIAEYVVELLKNICGGLEEKKNFKAKRRRMIRFNELAEAERKELIERDSRYGRVICRCETVTEGEIVDAIHRKVGATTVDGVKRRVRPGSGRCQGGFCGPRVMEILARELNKDINEIVKDSKGSYILNHPTKENREQGIW